MRVIAGKARGMKLKAPRGKTTRPTADRVKESLFSILGPGIIGANIVDLFAGSGALGIEALSRGANHCIFVEKNRSHLEIIGENLKRTGFRDRARLLGLEAEAALRLLSREKHRTDLFLIDPPYHSTLIPKILQLIYELQLISESGLVVVEHSAQNSAWTEKYPACKQKKYGDTRLSFIGWHHLQASAEKESQANGPDNI